MRVGSLCTGYGGLDLALGHEPAFVADAIRQRGFDRGAASQVFSQAGQSVPILEVLSRRHNDPDDPFGINDFLAGAIFDDPVERQRMRRLVAQERVTDTGVSRTAQFRILGNGVVPQQARAAWEMLTR